MDMTRLQALLDAKRQTGGNVEITAQELVDLVKASQTSNEGLRKAATAVAGEPNQSVVLHFNDFADLMRVVSLPPPATPAPENVVPTAPAKAVAAPVAKTVPPPPPPDVK